MPENVPEYFPDPECVPACPPALGDDAQSSPGSYCNNYYAGLHPEMDYSTYSIVFAGSRGPVNPYHSVQCMCSLNGTIRYSVMPLCGRSNGENAALVIKYNYILL